MDVEIVKADKRNLLEVLYIIRECSRQLLEKGVKYWNNSLADYVEIEEDIASGSIFVVKINHVVVGTITLKVVDEGQAVLIDRLAIYPAYQKKGLAQKLIEFSVNYAKEINAKKIFGYIPVDDKNLTQLLEQNHFKRKGDEFTPPKGFVLISYEYLFNG
ncbi:MAG: hypothetical protein PWR03_190 [Tenuifilum sp.]|uniref:GNAT family N-acetyltransferase n=1 Tax=Tenuifilum sp. TaxID=2760880 RepID=UPI0024AA9869|nr:GNAT family N-acetyltransferase [Tenuifilum sp.]MDI3526007.1 hypothetical protein [Tenuifilum sp.]